mgnify:CR=1 FL=1
MMTAWRRLETFLSGMETPLLNHLKSLASPLETFLSGMETYFQKYKYIELNLPLKPSLVEWKLGHRQHHDQPGPP